MTIDLSSTPGNPAFELTQNYDRLMAITDLAELVTEAEAIVTRMVGHGISEKNHRRFTNTINHLKERGMFSVQKYLSDYILKASGNGVI